MIRHFIDIDNFSKKELNSILATAFKMKKNINKYKNLLSNKSLGILLQKQSTRTRLSFNIGMQNLGGNVIELNSKEIGLNKRESDYDIIKTLSQYIDCLVVRNNNHKKTQYYASINSLPIINGLSEYSHPCQILSDIFTIKEKFNTLEKLTLSWVGDYNNVLRSLIQIQKIYKFRLNIVLPKIIFNKIKKIDRGKKIFYTNNLSEGVNNSHCVMTDVWVSMGEKNVNKKKLFKNYQINEKVMKQARKNAIFMHCLPANRQEEVLDEVIDGKQSIVWEQAKNRMYVQQAILSFILKK